MPTQRSRFWGLNQSRASASNVRVIYSEENKLMLPARPYNYAVFLQSMFYTGALTITQRNCHAIFKLA